VVAISKWVSNLVFKFSPKGMTWGFFLADTLFWNPRGPAWSVESGASSPIPNYKAPTNGIACFGILLILFLGGGEIIIQVKTDA